MSSIPRISVVMATYNRAKTVRRTLDCLFSQSLAAEDYEIIVIDDGSPDNTREVVEEMASSAPCEFTFLHHENRGPGYSQNRGIRVAKGDLLLLMADDIFMTPGALQAHLDAHERHPEEHVAVLGNVVDSADLGYSAFLRKWDPFLVMKHLRQDQELPPMLFWACNISCKRSFMIEHGMFYDPKGRAGAAAHEDVELGYRLDQHGLRTFHEKKALGHHYHPNSLSSAIDRSYERGLNWEEFWQRLPLPELLIQYRLYNLKTLIANHRQLAGPRQKYLLESDRGLLRLFVRYVRRVVLFNRITVATLWLPFIRMAESSRLIEACLRPAIVRGVIVYYFRKGCHDAPRIFAANPARPEMQGI